MSPLGLPSSWSRFFQEFHCSECGNDEAYRSRARGLVEKGLLPVLMLKPVRCGRCYHRSYAHRAVPVRERRFAPKLPMKQPPGTSDTSARVA